MDRPSQLAPLPAPLHSVEQAYWSYPELPHAELRSTQDSRHGYKSHSHKEFSIGAIISGEVRLTYRGASYLVSPGSLVVIEPEAVHSCNPLPGESRSYHMLYLDHDWCCSRMSAFYPVNSGTIHCGNPVLESPLSFARYLQLVEMLQAGQTEAASPLLDEFLDNLIVHYCRPDTAKQPERPLAEAMRRILLSNLNAPLPLSVISKDLGMREESLIRIFRKDTGLSPRAFLNNARIEKAKLLLRAGHSIVDTAIQLGFTDQSHFHKTFVHFAAATPKQYQGQYQDLPRTGVFSDVEKYGI